jgi:hypothetical protein
VALSSQTLLENVTETQVQRYLRSNELLMSDKEFMKPLIQGAVQLPTARAST